MDVILTSFEPCSVLKMHILTSGGLKSLEGLLDFQTEAIKDYRFGRYALLVFVVIDEP